jgi:Ras-related protein Rab-32
MTRVYYKEAVGCFIVFDVTRGSTFEAVTKWKTDLDNKVQLPDGNPVPCVLLANKVGFYYLSEKKVMIFFSDYSVI